MRVEPMGFPKDNAAGQYTADFVAPPAWDAFHQYGKNIGVHVSSFSLPGILFSAKPEWASRDANGNVSVYIGQGVSCPAVKAYMDHMFNVIDNVVTNYQTRWWGFDGRWLSYWEVPYYRPGPEGLGFDTCHATGHGHLPGDNLYMEWKNIQSFLKTIRETHPRLCLEAYYGLKRGEVWALRHLNSADNYYESNGAVMNRFQTWHNQNDRFRPVYKNYAAIFGGSPAAFRVNVLSSISTTSYCQIGRGYPDLALQENRDFLAQWRAWATTNHAYLKVKRDLFDCPGFKRIDGSAHISGNRGFLFLFPSGSGLTPRALVPMNRWIGLDEDPAALYRITEVYPQPGRLIGTYRYGDEFPFDMPAASPVVLSIDPAPAGAQPEQTVPLLDAAQVVSVAAFSSTNPGTATQWTNYPYHLSSMATATWNESSGEMGISQSSAGGSGLFRTGSSRLPTDPVTMRVKQLNRTGGGWGIVGLMISAARQPGYFTTADDTYTLAVAALGGTSVRCEVRRTYLDGTGNYQLYVGPAFDLATSGPVRLDIVRNEAGNYEFLANGNLLYTSGGAAGDFYDAAAKDSLVYHQIVQAGDGAMTATVDNFGIDSTPPGLSTLSPANVATGVATAADLTAMFGEPVRKGTGNITLRKSADQSLVETFDVASSARITFSGTTLTIDPTSVLAGLTGYYVQIDPTAVKDLAGNSFAGITDTTTTAWSFTTGPPDTAEPALATLIPANGSSAAVINANLTATFNEPVQKGAGSITLRKSADNSLVETFDVASSPSITVSGATLTIDPASALETFTGHYVQIDAGAIRDLSGNSFAGISGATTWSFTTAGDAWTPAELPNKALWLDAADAASVVLSGSTVSQWNDKSGNGRNVAQANATYKPNYATASLNGNPAITFDGSDDYLMGNVPDSVFPVNITLVHVFVPLSTASTKGMLQIASALGSTSPWLLQQQSSPTQFKHYVNGNYQITETIATSSPCISVLTYSGSQWISWLNGTQGAASTGARGSYPGTSLYLGNGYNGYWNGRFGEVIATTSSLATEDRQKLEGYLAWKWGLQTNLPADHPYKNAAPAITGTATPVITTLNPANNATGVAVGDNLVTTFDRNIQKGTGNITLRKSADDSTVETFDVASSPRITVSGATLTIDPTNDLADATGYYVQIDTTAIKDSADNFFAGIADTTTWNFTTAVAPAPTPCAGLVLGDSTIAGYAPYTAVADFIYTPQQTSAGWQVTSIAVPGHTIYNQKTTYLATPGRTTVDYTIAQIGLNDMNPGEAASVAIARLQDLVNTINANKKPGSLTIISTMLPCKQRWMDGYGTVNGPIAQQKFLDMNEAIKGNGPNPISGVDYRVSAHTLLLDDGAGNLNPIYDTGDHIHENNAGRQVIASAWRDALVALGLLTSVADTTPPTTSTLSPADGAGGVAAGASLAVTFNEAIAIGTGDITIKNLTDNAQSTITITDGSQVSVAGSVLTINPTADLAGGKSYAIRIDATAIKDSSGNFFAGIADDTTWNFATDGTPPTVVTLSPADDATDGSPFGNLSAIFDENIQKGSGNITLKKSADDSVVETFDVATSPRVTVSGTQLTIDPTSILTGLTGYYVQIDAGAIKDLAGNPFPGISGSGTWSFTTAASSATAVITTADGNGADAYVHKGANGNNNYGGGTNLWAQDFSGTSSVAVYIRFDLSGYVSGSFTSATLSLTSNEQATVPLGSAAGRDFRIHGLLDGQAGNNWGEGTITYNNAPGLTIGSGVASADIDPAKTVLLANTLVQVGNGLMVDLSNPALLSFLNNDTDGLVTFIVSGPVTGASTAFDWAAKEHATLAAPTLTFDVIPEPSAALLGGFSMLALLRRRR
jgi:methionine-rich copper-binding protein CopC/lysophospholipase L1-like esterase